MKKFFISLFAACTLVSLTACDGLITKAVTSILNKAGSDSTKTSDENDKDVKMRFSACERQDDGQTSNGAYSALDVSLAVPEGEGKAQHNVARVLQIIMHQPLRRD